MNADAPDRNLVAARTRHRRPRSSLADIVLADPKAAWDARTAAARTAGCRGTRGRRRAGPTTGGDDLDAADRIAKGGSLYDDSSGGGPEKGTSPDDTTGEGKSSGETGPPSRQLQRGLSVKGGLGNANDVAAAEGSNDDSSSPTSPGGGARRGGGALSKAPPGGGPLRIKGKAGGGGSGPDPVPLRRLLKGDSLPFGATFKGSLKDVTEGTEGSEDAEADDGADKGRDDPVPLRRLLKGNPLPFGAMFKGSLKDVTKGAEADAADGGDDTSPEESGSVGSVGSVSRRLRKTLPSRRGRVTPMTSDAKSDATATSSSPSRQSSGRPAGSSTSSTSDSAGFVGWDNDASSESRPPASYQSEDASSTQSSRDRALPARMPLYAPGTWRRGKTGGPLPARRLTRSGGGGGGSAANAKAQGGNGNGGASSSFRGGSSLRNVAEDAVDGPGVADRDVHRHDDSSSQSSSGGGGDGDGGRLPPPRRRTPLYAPGTWRQATTGGPLPARRLTRGGGSGSARALLHGSSRSLGGKGASFRGSLRDVAEDREADVNDADWVDDLLSVGSAAAPGRRRRKTPSARRLRTRFRPFHSDTTADASESSSRMKESVDLMDFGVDPDGGRAFADESLLSLGDVSSAANTTSQKDSLSNFVDSQGFLGWNKNDASSTASTSGAGGHRRAAPTGSPQRARRETLDSSDSSLTNLVDSAGYLGWDSRRQLGDSAKDLGTDIGADDGEGDDGGGECRPAAAAAAEEEDLDSFEQALGSIDPKDLFDPSKSRDSGNPFRQLKRLSSKVTEGIAAAKRAPRNTVDGVPTEIRTKNRRGSWYRSDSEPLPTTTKAKDGAGLWPRPFGASWGGSSNAPGSMNIDDEYYSRGTFRINQEDDVDIGELRRELMMAAAACNEGKADAGEGRLKLGLWSRPFGASWGGSSNAPGSMDEHQ